MPYDVDPAEFVDLLAPAMRQAASIARALEGRVQNTPKKDEPTAEKQALKGRAENDLRRMPQECWGAGA